jgi:hypothetical protein
MDLSRSGPYFKGGPFRQILAQAETHLAAMELAAHHLCFASLQQVMKLTRAARQMLLAEGLLKATRFAQTQVGLYGKVFKGESHPCMMMCLCSMY